MWVSRSLVRVLIAATLLCAPAAVRADPLEEFNRAMFTLNRAVVLHVIEPSAAFLEEWVPQPVRQAGVNVYENLTEPEFIVGHLLAGNGEAAWISGQRMLLNSTLGLAGLIDVATPMGIERRHIEFGAALCQAGLDPGRYLVLPLIGPTNVAMASAVTGFIVGGWYALSLVSSALATADLVIDMSASAASLRHAGDPPPAGTDPYIQQRHEYWDYMTEGCDRSRH